MLTNNVPFVEYFNNGVNPDSIYESSAKKGITLPDGTTKEREFVFLSFTKAGVPQQALVSEAALESYKAEKYEDLEVSNIVDEAGVVSSLLSINKRGANKQKKSFAFMAVGK